MNTQYSVSPESARIASSLNVIAGIWLIISPFILSFNGLQPALWNTLIVGIIVVILAGIRAGNPTLYVGLSWLNLLLGIWLIVAPFLLMYSGFQVPLWNDIILGIIVGVLALWSALEAPTGQTLVRR